MIKLVELIGTPSLQYHIDNGLSLHENVYRYSSDCFIQLFSEARDAHRDGKIKLNEEDTTLLETTDIGLYGEYNGQRVPLDLPMLDEQGADTSWDDGEGNKITLQDILDMTKNIPQKEYPTEKLAKIVLNWDDNPEEIDRISQVEISKQYPILIMADESGKIKWILDGNHRAQKALRSKSETIPAKIIKPSNLDAKAKKVLLDIPMLEGSYEEGGEDDRKYALLRVEPRNYEDMIDKLQDMNINHNRISDTVIKVYTDRIPDKIIYNLTHDVWVDKFVLKEAEYQGKDVALNKPKRGGSKKFYVYVKNKKGNIVKVSFGGTTGLNVKIDEPGARSSFAARHKCATKKDKTKPGYWACNIGRYWKSLGGSKNFSGYW